MRVVLCAVAIGGWYPRGLSRMIERFESVSPGFEIQAHVNCYPALSPGSFIEDGVDYGPYCAKPYALMETRMRGADIGILLDCAFYPIRPIHPLIEHIAREGYYFCRNGATVGEWSSDRALERVGMPREEAFTVQEISSYCVGLNFADARCVELLYRWCGYAGDRLTFAGPHTNAPYYSGRNPGLCSADSRVRGHRHDQTVLSIIAHRMGMCTLVDRPRFTAYLGSESAETVLVNRGM